MDTRRGRLRSRLLRSDRRHRTESVVGAAAGGPRILTLAYACEPHKGSEPGAGWSMVRLLARLGHTTVITRANNRAAIEEGLRERPELSDVRFVYMDVPRWLSWWKKGHRGVRAYYLLWMLAAVRTGRRLHKQVGYDLCWHVTLANAWLGTTGALIGPRFVYGPVGAGVSLPSSASSALGAKGRLYNFARNLVRWVGRYMNPLARSGWRGASLILCQNPETCDWLPQRHRQRMEVFSNAIIEATYQPRQRERGTTALFAARLLAWKGGEFAVRALALLPGWRMIVCGDGPDRARLASLGEELGVADRIDWRGWVAREEVEKIMRSEADVFILPSLHDEGSAAVVEAMFAGLPVICLDRGGPALLVGEAGITIRSDLPPDEIVSGIAQALTGRLPTEDAIRKRCDELSFESRLKDMVDILRRYNLIETTSELAR